MFFFLFFGSYFIITCPLKFLQQVVDVEACPSIGGGIQFLRFGQGFGFPVGKALAFRNLFPEEDGVYLLQAGVFDAELPDIILQVQEVGGLYVRAFPHRPEIVAQ